MHNEFFNYMIDPIGFHFSDEVLKTIKNEGLEKIQQERTAVEEYLNKPDCQSVYGFNTLFGHNDHSSLGEDSQKVLLEKHLVGKAVDVPYDLVQSFFASRVLFFLNGGTGVPVSVFENSLNILDKNYSDYAVMNVGSTYSCGDVVQGSWLFQHILNKDEKIVSDSGALMSFINGYFYSTSLAVVFSSWFISVLDRFVECLDKVVERFSVSGVQLPVSLRDMRPLRRHIVYVVENLREALLNRMESQSSNPVFGFNSNGRVESVDSGNGFLDFRLTSALNMAIELAVIVGSYVQRFVFHYGELLNKSLSVDEHFVQPSKIALAELLGVKNNSAPVRDFAGMESFGVEDIFDLSSLTAKKLGSVSNSLSRELFVLEDLIVDSGDSLVIQQIFGKGCASSLFVDMKNSQSSLSSLRVEKRGQALLNLFV